MGIQFEVGVAVVEHKVHMVSVSLGVIVLRMLEN